MRRLSSVVASAALSAVAAAFLLASPAVAASGPVAAVAAAADECTVTSGDLTWGFKESFRSYISGTIANGTWETSGGATYATPDFSWAGGTGTFDPATQQGVVHFAGSIHFTGHDGLLDTTVANPTLSFGGDGTARLLLDLSSVTMEDALAGNTGNIQQVTQVPFVSLDLSTAPVQVDADATVVTGTGVPTAITAEGFGAFGSYEAGTAFDPLTFTLALDCAKGEASPEPSMTTNADADTEPASDASQAPDLSWLVWVIGAVAVAAILATVVWIVHRRRRGGSDDAGPDTQS
jgi:hypothetical protein